MWKSFFVFAFLTVSLYPEVYCQDNRSLDGSGNNINNIQFGSAGDYFLRNTSANFVDGLGEPDLSGPNPRTISNQLFAQEDLIEDQKRLSDFTWAFAQFLEHEISYMKLSDEEELNIRVPEGDDYFADGSQLHMYRAWPTSDSGSNSPRKYINRVSAFIDGSNIYGSDEERANWLRTFTDGKLKTSKHNLLPWNTVDGEFNGEIDASAPIMVDETHSLERYFVAGDSRANENPLLIAFHTIFVREHNRMCDILMNMHPSWNDERIYQRARKYTGALLQSITYNEWLPTVGINLPAYTGYKNQINAQVSNAFVGAAFQISNTLVNSAMIRMANDGSELSQGNISLGDAFYNPQVIAYVEGIDPYVKGMATQIQQDLDCKMIDAVRNFEYKFGQKVTDRAAISIHRGRDIGLPSYNQVRRDLGLPPYNSFDNLTSNAEAKAALNLLYDGDINKCDAWVGMLAEDHLSDAIVGQLTSTIIERQFQALRDGDRYFYTNDPLVNSLVRKEIEGTTLSDVIMRNTGIDLMQPNVFTAMSHENIPNGPEIVPIFLDAAIYPNPVQSELRLKVYLEDGADVSIKIMDYLGQQVFSTAFTGITGENFFTLDIDEACPRGFYNIILESRDKFTVKKFIKD